MFTEKSEKVTVVLRKEHYNKTGCINRALEAIKEENILIINEWNIAKPTNAVYPESYSVLSFVVYAFHTVSASLTWCIPGHITIYI